VGRADNPHRHYPGWPEHDLGDIRARPDPGPAPLGPDLGLFMAAHSLGGRLDTWLAHARPGHKLWHCPPGLPNGSKSRWGRNDAARPDSVL